MTEPMLSQPPRDEPSPGFTVRLPVLRRPPGSRALDEPALRARATQLYLASRLPPVALAANARGAVPVGPVRTGPGSGVPEAGVQAAPAPAAAASAVVSAVASAVPAAARQAARHGHWHLLPWVVMVGGIVLLTPWLIWAPVVGGLCLGLLLLQGGLVKYWISTRQDGVAAPVTGSRPDSRPFAHESGNPPPARESGPVGAIPEIESRRLKFANPGWLLTAVLVLLGVQAAMLLTTVQIKNGEPSAVAGALRAVQAGRAAAARPGGEAATPRRAEAKQPDADQRAAEPDETAGKRSAP